MTVSHRVRIKSVKTLSDDWYVLRKTSFDWLRTDGTWQTLSRETYDRGNGAVLMPYDVERGTVLLTRQFRYPAFVNGHDDLLLEAAAGLLDHAAPSERIRLEVQEELGLELKHVYKIFDCFMSPGSVTERLHFFIGRYSPQMVRSAGGGVASEGEDIEAIELLLVDALRMIETGQIRDGKTIILLQYLALNEPTLFKKSD